MRKTSTVSTPLPMAASISSLKYGKCHWSGASTTPSSDMKKFETILPTGASFACWFGLGGVLRQHAVDLAEGRLQALLHTHFHELFHRLGRREDRMDRHVGAAARRCVETDGDHRGRHLRVGVAVGV